MSPSRPEGAKQPSLHSFFKRKTPPADPQPAGVNGRVTIIKATDLSARGHDDEVTQISDDEDIVPIETTPPSKKPRKDEKPATKIAAMSESSSNYFGGKPSGQTNAARALNAVAGPSRPAASASAAPRRDLSPTYTSTNLDAFRLPSTAQSRGTASGSAFGDYSVAADPAEVGLELQAPPSTQRQRTAEQQARHEIWQKRLVDPRGLIPRRRSLALDEAAAVEARRLISGVEGEDEEPADGNDTPLAGDDTPGTMSDDERQRAAAGVGSKLAAKFGAKGSAETKGQGVKGRGKKKEEEVGPSGQTYTPLEKQYMEIKRDHPDVLLFMEVGYKYKFHGEDAKTAGRELGIASFPSRNFYTASIPTHRLHIHVKKLISLGYKVGVVSQMETAALKKVGENRNAPFTRELTHLFTAATYVEDPTLGSSSNATDDPIVPGSAPPPTNALVALVEIGMGGQALDERVRIGMVSVIPETGDVVWDEFDDAQVRTELETRLTHLQPSELLLPQAGLSKATEKVVNHFAGNTKTSVGSRIRIERMKDILQYSKAFDYLTKFYSRRPNAGTSKRKRASSEIDLTMSDEEDRAGNGDDGATRTGQQLDIEASATQQSDVNDPVGLAAGLPAEQAVLALVDFPKQVVIALAVAVRYMSDFGLQDAFRHRSSFTKFVNRAHMLLSSNTLVNLEIYRNQTDGGVHGSLLWLLDHTRTRMGRRLLREWIGRPLLDIAALQSRIDAIEEIIANKTYHVEKLRSLLVNMPDLIKGLTRIQYGKVTPSELATILVSLTRIGSEFKPAEGPVFRSALLNNVLKTLPTILEPARNFLNSINLKEARDGNIANLWSDPDQYPDVQDAKDCISICESELDQHLKEIRKIAKRPSLQYVTVAGIEYLVEIPIRDSKSVPAKWVKVQATKHVVRFHTPDVLRITQEREQHKEMLSAASKRAFASFQSDISECHSLIVVARHVAVIDCLMSLAQVAAGSGYCKPSFIARPELHIREGRHPMVEMLRDEAYVPFDIDFSEEHGCAKVITGPNMAGKSSCVRATALIVCMAQIGSFVPAASVTLGIHDAVQTRMGASDEIGRGKSTFMVELSETSDILRTLTPRTLVILDELGRGTSTYDGVAIAYATLSHVAGVGCNTLFVTHYPTVAVELAKEMPRQISNWHMAFDEMKMPDGSAEITFLYRLTRGLAEASFGVWCARLAGLPKSVLETAQMRSDILKKETERKALAATAAKVRQLLSPGQTPAVSLGTVNSLYRSLQ